MAGVPWHQIRGMRNIVTREYDNVVDDVLWSTSRKDIPALLEKLLKSRETLEKE